MYTVITIKKIRICFYDNPSFYKEGYHVPGFGEWWSSVIKKDGHNGLAGIIFVRCTCFHCTNIGVFLILVNNFGCFKV